MQTKLGFSLLVFFLVGIFFLNPISSQRFHYNTDLMVILKNRKMREGQHRSNISNDNFEKLKDEKMTKEKNQSFLFTKEAYTMA
jgi:hypothetical protein